MKKAEAKQEQKGSALSLSSVNSVIFPVQHAIPDREEEKKPDYNKREICLKKIFLHCFLSTPKMKYTFWAWPSYSSIYSFLINGRMNKN